MGGEETTLEGTVLTGGIVLQHATLEVSGEKRTAHRSLAFELDTDAGTVVVEVDDDTRVVPESTLEERWEALEGRPEAELLRDAGPAPDADVRFVHATVLGGDRVAVRGLVVSAEVPGGTYRQAKERRVTVVRARLVGVGDAPRAAIDRADAPPEPARRTKKDKKKGKGRAAAERSEGDKSGLLSRVGRGLLALVAAGGAMLLGVGAAYHDDLPYRLDLLVCGASLALVGLASLRLVRRPLVFVSGQGAIDTPAPGVLVASVAGTLALLAPMILLFADRPGNMYEDQRIYQGPVGFAMWSLALGTFAAAVLKGEWHSSRLVSRALSAKPHASPPVNGQWGWTEGVVRRAALQPPGGGKAALALLHEQEWCEGSSPNIDTERAEAKPFVLERDDGTKLGVDGAKATWSTTHRRTLAAMATAANKKVVLAVDLVPEDARALVVGRVRADAQGPRMDAFGKGSLVVFADASPRWTLRKAWWSGRLLAALLALLALALAVLTVWHPFLPPLHSGPGD
jgi:hypothetical protein